MVSRRILLCLNRTYLNLHTDAHDVGIYVLQGYVLLAIGCFIIACITGETAGILKNIEKDKPTEYSERYMMTDTEKNQIYKEVIEEALNLIELYDLEIRNAKFCPPGFCSGRFFIEGRANITMKLLCIEHNEKYQEKDK